MLDLDSPGAGDPVYWWKLNGGMGDGGGASSGTPSLVGAFQDDMPWQKQRWLYRNEGQCQHETLSRATYSFHMQSS